MGIGEIAVILFPPILTLIFGYVFIIQILLLKIIDLERFKMEKKNQNRETWVGYRPSVMPAKKKNKKHDRKEGKQICRDAMKGEKD